MKYFLVLLCFAMAYGEAAWLPKTSEQMKFLRNECIREHDLNEEQIGNIKELNYPNEFEVRQYMLCMATKSEVFSLQEGYNADRLIKHAKLDLTEEEALQIIKSCIDKNEQNSPANEWAYRGHVCIMSSKIGDKLKAISRRRRGKALQAKAQT